MKILKARVNPRKRLEILVDKIPLREAAVFEWCSIPNGRRFYLSVQEKAYARYYTWKGPGNEGGYYGREFPILVHEDGQVREATLLGPWSSRAGVINTRFKQQIVDVSITDDPEAFERGYTFMAGAVTLHQARKAAKMAGVSLSKHVDDRDPPGDITYRVISKRR